MQAAPGVTEAELLEIREVGGYLGGFVGGLLSAVGGEFVPQNLGPRPRLQAIVGDELREVVGLIGHAGAGGGLRQPHERDRGNRRVFLFAFHGSNFRRFIDELAGLVGPLGGERQGTQSRVGTPWPRRDCLRFGRVVFQHVECGVRQPRAIGNFAG